MHFVLVFGVVINMFNVNSLEDRKNGCCVNLTGGSYAYHMFRDISCKDVWIEMQKNKMKDIPF